MSETKPKSGRPPGSKKECDGVDASSNHCPGVVEHEVEDKDGCTMYLCDKCYGNVLSGSYGEVAPRIGRPLGSRNKPGHGAGRPPLSEDEPTERHMILMPASWWRYVESLENGNRSAGVRVAVEEAMRK